MAIATGASLLPAFFKGVPFLYLATHTGGGRKLKVFEFPNRDTREVQDLGKLQRSYRITAIIQGDDLTYPILVKLFKEALESEGSGIFIHPTDGVVEVFSTPYVMQESFDKIGVATFTLSFLEVGSQTFPANIQALSAAAKIAQTALGVIASLNQGFTLQWIVNLIFPQIATVSTAAINLLSQQFKINTNLSNKSNLTGITTFNNSLETYQKAAPANAINADSLTTQTSTLFEQYGDVTANINEQSGIMELFFQYSTSSNVIPTTTSTQDADRNLRLFDQYLNAISLIYDYIFSTQIIFETADDIQVKNNILDTQFAYILLNNTYTDLLNTNSPLLDPTTLSQLEDLRVSAHDYLNSQPANDRRVITITVNNASLLPLAYQYYGNIDNFDKLATLNNVGLTDNLSNEFEIISDAN